MIVEYRISVLDFLTTRIQYQQIKRKFSKRDIDFQHWITEMKRNLITNACLLVEQSL